MKGSDEHGNGSSINGPKTEHGNFIAAKCKFIPFAGNVVKMEVWP